MEFAMIAGSQHFRNLKKVKLYREELYAVVARMFYYTVSIPGVPRVADEIVYLL